MNRIVRNVIGFLLVFGIVFAITGCKKEEDYSNVENPIVTMEFEEFGVVEIELYPQVAPNTVKNFIHLIENGFYDGLTIHRIVPGFVIQEEIQMVMVRRSGIYNKRRIQVKRI